MADKKKSTFTAPAPKGAIPKRPTTVVVASERTPLHVNQSAVKPKISSSRLKPSRNTTIIGDADITMSSSSNYDDDYRQNSYGMFLRALLKDCLVDEKIEREETEVDIQMSQLAARLQRSYELMDKTNRRLKEINFACEHKRLLDLKKKSCEQFYEATNEDDSREHLQNLTAKEESYLDRLETRNVEFGYKESGHKKLLDAVNDAIAGLEDIKKESKLDESKFKVYEKSQELIDAIDKESMELEKVKREFEEKFPNFNEKILKESSKLITKLIDSKDADDD